MIFTGRIRWRMYTPGIRLFVCLFLWAGSAAAQQKNDSVFNKAAIERIALVNAGTGKSFYLHNNRNANPATLFIFLSPECPLCKNYAPVLNDLYKQYATRVNIYGIIPGKAYTATTIKTFKKEYNLPFPLLIDQHKKLTNYLQASVTPQVILIDANYNLLYKGAIDNRLQTLGKERVRTTAFYLNDALQQYLLNNTIAIKRTKAVGCIINNY